jgi:hypothetical protein
MAGTLAPSISIPISDQDVTQVTQESLPQQLTQIRNDLQTLGFTIQKTLGVTRFGGWGRVPVPLQGPVRVWILSSRATAGSTGAAYHVFNVTRNGQAEAAQQWDTRATAQGELAAFTEYFMGEFQCGQGDQLAANVTVTGAPAPQLAQTDFTLRCELKPA